MWSQCPWVSSTLPTLSRWHSSRSFSCSLAASMSTDSPVCLQRRTKTLLSMGPTTSLWISAWESSKCVDGILTARSSRTCTHLTVAVEESLGGSVNFAFSEEQDELRKSVRRFLDDKSPSTEVRRLMETTEGYDPAVWSQMAEQLGLQGLAIPEEYGGSGFTYVELVVVLEEMGKSLLCAPYFSTVALAANALLTSGDDSAKKE